MTTSNTLGIEGIESVHVFVRDHARIRDHYVRDLGFSELAVSSAAFEAEQRVRASIVQAGAARFMFVEPLGSSSETYRFLQRHPEGVGRLALKVTDAER